VNQPTLSPEHDEEPTKDDGEPAKDDEEPTDDQEEEAPQAAEEEEEKEEEALAEEVDNITETILVGFTAMPRYKKRRLNHPSPNTIMEEDDPSSK